MIDGFINCQDQVLNINSAVAAGTTISLPSGMQYIVGTNTLEVSYNGTVCHVNENFLEVGTAGAISTSIKLTFDVVAGDQIGFHISGFGEATEIPAVVHKSGDETINGVKTFGSSPVVPMLDLGDYSNNVVSSKWIKDISAADVYVSPDGDDSNSGMSAAESVKTIAKAIEISSDSPMAGSKGTTATIHLAAGAYNGNISFGQLSIHIIPDGNVSIIGNITLLRKSKLIFVGGSYSLTINGNITLRTSSLLFGENTTISINGTVQIYDSLLYSETSISISSTTIFEILDSIVKVYGTVSVTTSATSGQYAVSVGQSSFLHITGGLNISSQNRTNSILYITHGSNVLIGGLSITGSGNAVGIILNELSYLFTINISISSGCLDGSGISVSEKSVLYCVNGPITVYAKSNPLLISTLSLVYFGGTVKLYGGATTNTHMISATDCSAYLQSTGSLEITSGTNGASTAFRLGGNADMSFGKITLTISGKYTTSVISATSNSTFVLTSTATTAGSPTGIRYSCGRGSQINVGGAGVNKIPGSAAGTVDSASFGFYG